MGKTYALVIFCLLMFATFPSSAQAMDDGKAQSGIASSPPSPRMGQQLYETIQKVADYFKRQHEAGPNIALWPGNPISALQEFDGIRTTDFQAVEEFARITQSTWEKQVAYYVLITQPVAAGEIELSMAYLSRLEKEYPISPVLEGLRKEDLNKLDSTYREYRRILASQRSKDEELWQLANLFHEGLQLEFNTADEFSYDLRFPLSLLEKIVQQFPKSPLADDAEYRLIEWGDHRDCCADLELIPVYEAFIKKYPDSNLIPEARLDIAYEYKAFVEWGDELGNSATEEQVWAYLTKARQIVWDVLKKYPAKQASAGARDFLREIQCMLESKALRLSVQLAKETWTIGEPVEVTIELVNVAPMDMKIWLDPKPPNFTLNVRDGKDNLITFLLDSTRDSSDDYKPVDWLLVSDGGKYKESCILQKNCLNNSGIHLDVIRPTGAFTLDRTGQYYIDASYRNPTSSCTISSERRPVMIGP
jgi:hypothetical protein